MGSLVEKIPQEEKQMIKDYIFEYAFPSGGEDYFRDKFTSIDKVLNEWNYAKRELYNLFGEEFILKKNIEYTKGIGLLMSEINKILWGSPNHPFSRKYFIWASDYARDNWDHEKVNALSRYNYECKIGNLLDAKVLAENEYKGEDFCILKPDGKVLKIRKGCKPVKALGKIAEAFGFEDFEDFRLKHSQVLNQKKLSGELCLSIHPMDFFTMSDNNCDWNSCMSWIDDGCYRRGTVEMMNSTNVIVAYLNSHESFNPFSYDDRTWSNKKWRCLFIIDSWGAVSIKSYPYENSNLTEIVLTWVKELLEKKNDMSFSTGIHTLSEDGDDIYLYEPKEGINLHFTFETNTMYNDFMTTTHYAILSDTVIETKDLIYCLYSGEESCLCCGEVGQEYYNEEDSEKDTGRLVCDVCHNVTYCDECGKVIIGDDLLFLGNYDYVYCKDCYNKLAIICPISSEEYCRHNAVKLFIIPDSVKEDINKNPNNATILENIYNLTWYKYYILVDFNSITDRFYWQKTFKNGIYGRDCQEVRLCDSSWHSIYTTSYSNLTDEGIEAFSCSLPYSSFEVFLEKVEHDYWKEVKKKEEKFQEFFDKSNQFYYINNIK